MAQDYNIYIHSLGGSNGGGTTNPTIPRDNQQNNDGAFEITPSNIFNESQNVATNGFAPYVKTGVAKLAKTSPIIAGIIIAGIVADKVLSVGFQHQEDYTGNYQNNMAYNNIKTMLTTAFNPVGLAKNMYNMQYQNKKYNLQQQEQRTLLGKSVISNKVGV